MNIEPVESFFDSIRPEETTFQFNYWDGLKPINDTEKFQRWLFAFMSVHTSWERNIIGYNNIKHWWNWINRWDHLENKLIESRVGMQNNRTRYIKEFTIKFWSNPSYYDNVRSSLARPGSTQSVLGQGGLLDAGIGIVTDLQNGKGLTGVIGAIQKAGTVYNTFKGKNIRATINEEANAALKATLRKNIPGAVRSNGGLNVMFNRAPKGDGFGP